MGWGKGNYFRFLLLRSGLSKTQLIVLTAHISYNIIYPLIQVRNNFSQTQTLKVLNTCISITISNGLLDLYPGLFKAL